MKQILLVDDDKMNCMVAKHALGTEYIVVEVHSGREAMVFLENQKPDIILMDIEMPEMNGKEAAQLIKEREEWSNIPIIFLTADANPATEIECLEWGADDYITKPFVPRIMQGRVGRILELYELRKSLERQLEKKTKQMEVATQKSLTDALTGLHNRDYLGKQLQCLLGEGHSGALFMIDLDNFKTMNDTYGHIIGDKTLQYFADVLRTFAEQKDIVCRLAGDEFVTFYTDTTDRTILAQKAENIIKEFAEKMGELGYPGVVSVSIGIMVTSGGETFQTLYNKADTSLYFVKNNGKNAYHFYGEHKDNLKEINTLADMETIRQIMEEGLDSSRGAYHVAYSEFKGIYDFVRRFADRKKQKMQIVLLTLDLDESADVSEEEAMQYLEETVVLSLRAMDAGTKYSNKQYIVLLLDTDEDNGKLVTERLIRNFRKKCESISERINISYNIQTREPQ